MDEARRVRFAIVLLLVQAAPQQQLRLGQVGFHLALEHHLDQARVPLGDAGLGMPGDVEGRAG